MTGKWLIHLVLRGAAESIISLVLQCLLQRGEQHTGSCRQYPVPDCPQSAQASLCPEPPGIKSRGIKVTQGVQVTISELPRTVQFIWQFKEISVRAVSPSQSCRNSAMLRHFWHNRDLCSFPSLVSGLSEELLSCTLTSLALLFQRVEISHQSLGAWRVTTSAPWQGTEFLSSAVLGTDEEGRIWIYLCCAVQLPEWTF